MFIQLAATDRHILDCFPIVQQLGRNLTIETFLPQVQCQQQQGYQLAFGIIDDQVIAIAGFQIAESLAWGKFLYIYDLAVDEPRRSQGQGQQLFEWLVNYGQQQCCTQIHLDSGVQRFAAHRFYHRQGKRIVNHHGSIGLQCHNQSLTKPNQTQQELYSLESNRKFT
jgi:ribosomal protein S18 acetylase RimI-like enzyme